MSFLPFLGMMAASGLFSQFGGSESGYGSTYNEQEQGAKNRLLQMAQGQSGAGNIQSNPMYQQGNEYFQNLFNDPNFFKSMEAPALQQFNEQLVPDIANRFAGAGSAGSTNSTGFRNAIAREGQTLSSNLAAQRGQMQANAVPQMLNYAQQPFQNLMSLYNQGIGQGTNNQYFPAQPGFGAPIAQGLAQGGGMGLSKYLFGGT